VLNKLANIYLTKKIREDSQPFFNGQC